MTPHSSVMGFLSVLLTFNTPASPGGFVCLVCSRLAGFVKRRSIYPSHVSETCDWRHEEMRWELIYNKLISGQVLLTALKCCIMFFICVQLWLKAELAKKADNDSGPIQQISKSELVFPNSFDNNRATRLKILSSNENSYVLCISHWDSSDL